MLRVIPILALTLTVSAAHANDSSHIIAGDAVAVPVVREAFHCQPFGGAVTVNASDWYQTEIADDFPEATIGEVIHSVTLYPALWLPDVWQDPNALIVSFYREACPPPLSPDFSYDIAWDDLETELVWGGPPFVVYEVTAALPAPVLIEPGLSMGVQLHNSWEGPNPASGFGVTDEDDIFGCDELYWDGGIDGPPRWTRCTEAFGHSWDLAYCLSSSVVSVPDDPEIPVSWGRVKSLYR